MNHKYDLSEISRKIKCTKVNNSQKFLTEKEKNKSKLRSKLIGTVIDLNVSAAYGMMSGLHVYTQKQKFKVRICT